MRRTCLTIVYLVAIGLPLAHADEPEWKPVGDAWVAPPKSSPAVDLNSESGLVAGLLEIWVPKIVKRAEQVTATVSRPAWPTVGNGEYAWTKR